MKEKFQFHSEKAYSEKAEGPKSGTAAEQDAAAASGGCWLSSIREFRRLRNVIFCGMMGALSIILSYVGTIRLGPTMRIGVGEIPNVMVDYLFGPAAGMIFGGVMDIVKYMLNPDGAFFPGFTLSAMAGALIFGFFLYRRKLNFWRLLAAEALVKAFVNVGLNTIWLNMLYGKGFLALLPPRIISNLILLPLDTILLWFVLQAVSRTIQPELRKGQN